ncbi:hypothetical protein B0A48_01420 [Cryoendolithus antarcticus]|uniref:F-box domain-containing protein n=1 Tax=Cryoendolithus antarcticus TaxID=1507870 RepID=A0A1V8TTN8_9PEZI|nr:hypothetical protein B0A48_01420 [Cryoendolithus antarcticus]
MAKRAAMLVATREEQHHAVATFRDISRDSGPLELPPINPVLKWYSKFDRPANGLQTFTDEQWVQVTDSPSLHLVVMSPISRVVGIPELIENILLHATVADVLRSQRVSKTFQRIIQASPRLQEKLFFKAKPTHSNGTANETEINYLLLSALGAQYLDCIYTIHHLEPGAYNVLCHEFSVHFKCARDRHRTLNPGSWERMLLMQPPQHEEVSATGAVIEWRTEGNKTRGLHRYLNKKENPALLKALKKLVVEMRKQSRILRGVAYPNDLLEEATASGETDGEVDVALRLAASPDV